MSRDTTSFDADDATDESTAESADESTYDGPDDDLASGNITDADFAHQDEATTAKD
jgi:hypothetical protein